MSSLLITTSYASELTDARLIDHNYVISDKTYVIALKCASSLAVETALAQHRENSTCCLCKYTTR